MRPITIIGGGLAGLTLGIALRRHSVPVIILEASHYPRHRVCGEFINGRGLESLHRLGLLELIRDAGALPAQTVKFFSSRKAFLTKVLPRPALCISRFVLDALLAKKFCELGGVLHQDSRLCQERLDEGMVRSSGRKPQPTTGDHRWFGLKGHAQNVVLAADLEIHFVMNGYVGLCRLNGGEVNVCGLFRRITDQTPARQGPKDRLRGEPGTCLHDRLTAAEWDDKSVCAVAGVSLKPERAGVSRECRLGDALTLTPPVTGNGMSMAFEAAELAIDPLLSYAAARACWATTQRRIAQRCDAAFAWRLRWAKMLHSALLRSSTHERLLRVLSKSEVLWRFAYWMTR